MDDMIQEYNALILSNSGRNQVELETRACFQYHGKAPLISSIPFQTFKYILEMCENYYPESEKYREVITCYDNNIRKIVKNNGEPRYEIKTRITNTIMDSKYTKFLKWKCVVSTEVESDEQPEGEPRVTRLKKVNVFRIHPYWKLYLTQVFKDSSYYPIYEAEVERIHDDDHTNLCDITEINVIDEIMAKFFSRHKVITSIIRDMNTVLNVKNKYNFVWPINKPINIKYDMWENIRDNYYCYPKHDGERYLLYFRLHNIYRINDTSAIHTLKISHDEKLHDTIIDTELVGKIYHVFDVLVLNGRDVRQLSFIERRNMLETLTFPSNIKLSPLYKSFKPLIKIVKKPKRNTDGLIFIPIHIGYKNTCTYKYKPSELLTIDFVIDDNQNLYCMGMDQKLVEFLGSEQHPYIATSVNICTDSIEPNEIYECTYDKSLKQFTVIRHRGDKQRPNNISVALDVWYDIHNPININSFLENISSILNK